MQEKDGKIIGKTFGDIKISRTFASLLKRNAPGRLAQLVQSVCLTSRGSARVSFQKAGRLAQLVQSVCLTSRGSAVRIRQRPRNCYIQKNAIIGSPASDLSGYFFCPYSPRRGVPLPIRRGCGRLLPPCARAPARSWSSPRSALAGSAGAG